METTVAALVPSLSLRSSTWLQGGGSAHLVHGHCCLHPRCHRVHSRTHPQEVDGLVLLPDGIFSVYPSNLCVAFLNSL